MVRSKLAIFNELVYRFNTYDKMTVLMTLGLDKYIRSIYAEYVHDNSNRIVDAGSGTGRNIPYIYSKARQVICIDISLTALRVCKLKYRNYNNVDIVCASCEYMPIKSSSIDIILTSYTLRHLNVHKFISEVRRVCHRKSRLIVVDFWKPRTTLRTLSLLVHLSTIVTFLAFLTCPYIVSAYVEVWKELVKLPRPQMVTRMFSYIGNVKLVTIVDIIYIWIVDIR